MPYAEPIAYSIFATIEPNLPSGPACGKPSPAREDSGGRTARQQARAATAGTCGKQPGAKKCAGHGPVESNKKKRGREATCFHPPETGRPPALPLAQYHRRRRA